DVAKPLPKPYGWDRTAYSPDESRASRDDYLPDDIPVPNDFTFKDFLSIFNPLQQLPVVSTIYRAVTGEKIHPLARVIGGALVGGPLGLLGAVVNNVVETLSGKDIGDHVLAAILPSHDTKPSAPAPQPSANIAATAAPRSLGERLAAVFLPDREAASPDMNNV